MRKRRYFVMHSSDRGIFIKDIQISKQYLTLPCIIISAVVIICSDTGILLQVLPRDL